MPEVWRIASHTDTYAANDLSGGGAKATGGRWNQKGLPVVYASLSMALACLETFVHLGSTGLPLNRYLVRIEIPGELWDAGEFLAPVDLPTGWDAEPAALTSIGLGSDWLKEKKSTLLFVPSVIVPEEWNVLLNPLHADFNAISASMVRRWLYDPRMVPP